MNKDKDSCEQQKLTGIGAYPCSSFITAVLTSVILFNLLNQVIEPFLWPIGYPVTGPLCMQVES